MLLYRYLSNPDPFISRMCKEADAGVIMITKRDMEVIFQISKKGKEQDILANDNGRLPHSDTTRMKIKNKHGSCIFSEKEIEKEAVFIQLANDRKSAIALKANFFIYTERKISTKIAFVYEAIIGNNNDSRNVYEHKEHMMFLLKEKSTIRYENNSIFYCINYGKIFKIIEFIFK